jgi:hypothetical protein
MKQFSHAFLQEIGGGHMRHEEQLLRQAISSLDVPITTYTSKDVSRRRLPVSRESFFSGDVDAVHGILRQLNIQVPELSDYPAVLAKYLGRRVWQSTLDRIEQRLLDGEAAGIFVKPLGRKKAFRGRVLEAWEDLRHLGGVSRMLKVWCSEVVSWQSEYRVYVCEGKILSVDHYQGDQSALNMRLVEAAVVEFHSAGQAPAAYALDFGVLGDTRTALVEFHDGYSLGAYDISAEKYRDLLFARWHELLSHSA